MRRSPGHSGAARIDRRAGGGRHVGPATRAPRRRGRRLAESFPGLLGPSRRAAHRRFVLRRASAAALVLWGYALALAVDLPAVTQL
ncbi:MAG: hypothetical protein WCA30_10010 [Dermatophilaceae bacterium]